MKRSVASAICTAALCIAAFAYDPASSCVRCHGNRAQMKRLGAEALYLDPARVDQEVNMKGAPTCVDCHQGNPKARQKQAAHRGLLRPHLLAGGKTTKAEVVERAAVGLTPLAPSGHGPAAMIPKPDKVKLKNKGSIRVLELYYHDRDPKTLAYSQQIARKTCGKCHAKQVADYDSSFMGLVKNQRANRSFAEPLPGPHNCGAWFGENYQRLKAETTLPYSPEQNAAGARGCNSCHAGCNDCHYKPFLGAGTHTFGRPEAASCYGGMRGSVCHAGPMERRRGAGFLRGGYAYPRDEEFAPDVHAKRGMQCLDCHKPVNHHFGNMANPEARNACQNCHKEIVAAMENSQHSRVDCESCHVTEVGGYQFTFWGPGDVLGVESPYKKHMNYYGTRGLPTLIRNATGRWIPVKPFPMAAMNQSREVQPSKLLFRAIPQRSIPGNPAIGEPETFTVSRAPGETNDAVIINGTRSDLPGGAKALLWIQLDKMSHALGTGRGCESCHASHAQVSHADYLYYDGKDVTVPFRGSYTVVADDKGIRFTGMKNDPITPVKGRKLEDFAPFVFFPKAWDMAGIDFSIPFREEKYRSAAGELQTFLKQLDGRPQNARTKLIRAVAYHNLAAAKKMPH